MTTPAPSDGTTIATASSPLDHDRLEAMKRLEGSFADLMAEFRQYYIRAAETAAPGMLPGTFKILSTIERDGAATVSGLAERFAADKGQISRGVSELEERGFVVRRPDASDGRIRSIDVTDLGRERVAAARGPWEERFAGTLSSWPVSSIETLTDLLHALTSGTDPAPDRASATRP